jgi:hypothetical protein
MLLEGSPRGVGQVDEIAFPSLEKGRVTSMYCKRPIRITRRPLGRRNAARPQRGIGLTLMIPLLIGGALALGGCGADADDPRVAVREFLVAAAVDHNGEAACSFMTGRARRQAERSVGEGVTCQEAFDDAQLSLDGTDAPTGREIYDLPVEIRGDASAPEAMVRVDGRIRSFRLVRADPNEQDEFEAPNTEWRIDSGAAFLVRTA